jgi:hypothetical protein
MAIGVKKIARAVNPPEDHIESSKPARALGLCGRIVHDENAPWERATTAFRRVALDLPLEKRQKVTVRLNR